MNVFIRNCNKDDCEVLFNWVNDIKVRENSIQNKIIQFEDHVAWFKNMLESNLCQIYILCLENNPIGQIRFDFTNENEWTIDFSIATEYRNKGFGKLIVKLGIDKLKNSSHPIVAIVNINNINSIKIFKSLNFTEISILDINDEKYIKFLKE